MHKTPAYSRTLSSQRGCPKLPGKQQNPVTRRPKKETYRAVRVGCKFNQVQSITIIKTVPVVLGLEIVTVFTTGQ